MYLSRTERKYWKPVKFANKLEGAVANDGLLYMFEESDVVAALKRYPSNRIGWYFNASRDRFCAERIANRRVTINPSAVYEMFGDPLPDEPNPVRGGVLGTSDVCQQSSGSVRL